VNSLNANGHRAVLCGTTNLDEAGFLGFFGKFSEGAVDVQPITDLHKSEVYATAKFLGVPEEIMNRTPRGDMHEPLSDEQMFGAPYGAVELMRPVLNREAEEGVKTSSVSVTRTATSIRFRPHPFTWTFFPLTCAAGLLNVRGSHSLRW
jgi:NAD+ synthetase